MSDLCTSTLSTSAEETRLESICCLHSVHASAQAKDLAAMVCTGSFAVSRAHLVDTSRGQPTNKHGSHKSQASCVQLPLTNVSTYAADMRL